MAMASENGIVNLLPREKAWQFVMLHSQLRVVVRRPLLVCRLQAAG